MDLQDGQDKKRKKNVSLSRKSLLMESAMHSGFLHGFTGWTGFLDWVSVYPVYPVYPCLLSRLLDIFIHSSFTSMHRMDRILREGFNLS
jgi:hypothetical protein